MERIEFRPSTARLVALYGGSTGIAGALSVALVPSLLPAWSVVAFVVFGVVVGIAVRGHFAVVVTADSVEGPGRPFGRVRIARADLVLSPRLGPLRASHLVLSRSGGYFFVIRRYFDRETLKALLSAVASRSAA